MIMPSSSLDRETNQGRGYECHGSLSPQLPKQRTTIELKMREKQRWKEIKTKQDLRDWFFVLFCVQHFEPIWRCLGSQALVAIPREPDTDTEIRCD